MKLKQAPLYFYKILEFETKLRSGVLKDKSLFEAWAGIMILLTVLRSLQFPAVDAREVDVDEATLSPWEKRLQAFLSLDDERERIAFLRAIARDVRSRVPRQS